MFTKTSSKGALTASIISLVICFAMLLGTTFAWFSTAISSSVNTIKSGNLTIDLVDENDETLVGKTLNFVDTDGAPIEDALWEPGFGYTVQDAYVKNTGTVDVKFKIDVVGIDGDQSLVKVIDWTVNGAEATEFEGTLASGETYGPITLAGKMQETAGNQYMNKTADGIAIVVYATQAAAGDDAYEEVAALVKELDEMPTVRPEGGSDVTLDTAYTFTNVAETATDEYKDWNADYVISFNQDVAAGAVVLAGQYDSWSPDWVAFANPDAIAEGEAIRLLESYNGTYVTYEECCEYVKEFNCGAASDVAGLTMTVELRLYERVNGVETGEYVTAGTFTYTF